MLDREIASVMKFVLTHTHHATPYYHEVPQGFAVPSVYFPVPEVTPVADTLTSYGMEFSMYIKLFHSSTERAHEMGFEVITALAEQRNNIPLISDEGTDTRYTFRIKEVALKKLENAFGVAQISLSWCSPRAFPEPEVQKMMRYDADINAYDAAVEQITKGGY